MDRIITWKKDWRLINVLPQLLVIVTAIVFAMPGQVQAQDETPPALELGDLPPIPNLDKFIKDEDAAIKLGKALFWDMQGGSDGQACASCHFKIGADPRRRNQINPATLAGDMIFDATRSGALASGPDYTLVNEDFPFHEKVNELDRSLDPGNVAFDTDDVASSMGVNNSTFDGIALGLLKDDCTPVANFFNGSRNVEPRHTPTVYNAALNFENFWDGRAKNNFNGVNPFGLRDPNAMVWRNNGSLEQVTLEGDLELINSSLASQAVGPPVSDFEMSCANRVFADIGKKMVTSQPLKFQKVHLDDSVFAGMIVGDNGDGTGTGLAGTYSDLIEAAFEDEWWNAPGAVDGPFTHKEANFSLFWGIAIMMYERTLISTETKFDESRRGNASLTAQEERGLDVFLNQGNCVNCHATAMFTKASTLHLIDENQEEGLVERMLMGDQMRGPALYDNGFYNIGVRPTDEDIGRGGTDPIPESGESLSFTRQYIDMLLGENVPDPFQIDECKFEIRFDDPATLTPLQLDGNLVVTADSGDAGDLNQDGDTDPFPMGFEFVPVDCDPDPDTIKPKLPSEATFADQADTIANFRTAVDGAMKVPSLRLVQHSGPFFHNGGNATLFQVVAFYNRGGDFFEVNQVDVDPDIVPLNLTLLQRLDLIAFLKTLTDPRVLNDEDVYDHPQLFVPNGGIALAPGDVLDCVDAADPQTGVGECLNAIVVPAIGENGLSAEMLPMHDPFQESPTSGDLNGDTVTNFSDAFVLFGAFGTCNGDPGFDPAYDYDTSGCIDFVDWQFLFALINAP